MPRKIPRPGQLFIVSAPSGGGKTTVVDRLLAKDKNLWRSVSATTRKKRPGERSGRDYVFLTEKRFREKIARRFFLEWEEVFGRYYGTPRAAIEKKLKSGRDVVLVIDVKGARRVMKKRRTLSIFLKPPSLKELARRLTGRRTDSPEEQKKRLSLARQEMSQARFYDAVVVNQDLERTVTRVKEIMDRYRRRSLTK